MINGYNKEMRKLLLGLGLIFLVIVIGFSVVCVFKIGGFKNSVEVIFFIKRKIQFILYKLFSLIF